EYFLCKPSTRFTRELCQARRATQARMIAKHFRLHAVALLLIVSVIVSVTHGINQCLDLSSKSHKCTPDAVHLRDCNLNDDDAEDIVACLDYAGRYNISALYFGHHRDVTTLPANLLSDMPILEILIVNSCGLKSLPEDLLWEAPNLQVVRLNDNDLESLPAEMFSGLELLDTLTIKHNRIKTIPSRIFSGLSRLRILQLEHNEL
ncbi:unnamed protein product, partial [Ascophyllum nodosum]